MKDGETCQSPLCESRFEPLAEGDWRRTPRKFCSDGCKQQASLIRRVAALLEPLGKEKAWKVLSTFGKDP
jgi:hypothetical protein